MTDAHLGVDAVRPAAPRWDHVADAVADAVVDASLGVEDDE